MIKFKPTLLSYRLRISTPDTVWLNPKLRFKFRIELIASRGPKMIKFTFRALRGEVTERFLSRQTVKFTKMTETDLEEQTVKV